MPEKPSHSDPLRRGLYAGHFSASQRAALKKMGPADISYELAAHRVVSAKILGEIMACEDDPTALVKLATAWRAAVSASATLARTLAVLTGHSSPLDEAIDDFLSSVDPYLTED